MKVLIEINILKALHSHALILPILRVLLVSLKLQLPLFLVPGVAHIQGFPFRHAEAWFGQSGVPAHPDHEEHGARAQQQPAADQTLFTW